MTLIVISIVLPLGFVFLVAVAQAVPARFRRNVPTTRLPLERATVSVTQIVQAGFSSYTEQVFTGDCISVRNPNFTNNVWTSSAPRHGLYSLVGSSTPNCSQSGQVITPVNHNRAVILNRRVPILSFHLEKSPSEGKNVTVAFTKYDFDGSIFSTTISNKSCFNVGDSTWVKYAQSVKILKEQGGPANNYISVYSEPGCLLSSKIAARVKGGANLVDLTQEKPAMKSFVILNRIDNST